MSRAGTPAEVWRRLLAVARLVLWSGLDSWRAEVVSLDLSADGIVATGTQMGADPVAYRLDYRLEAGPGCVPDLV